MRKLDTPSALRSWSPLGTRFGRSLSSRQPWIGTRPPATRRIRLLIAAGALTLGLLVLAACGASYNSGPPPPTRPVSTAGSTVGPGPTSTPGQQQYAYLYSRVDYPLQVPVNAGDTVTLTLSTQSNILTVTPGPGSGSESAGAPIPLPTDLQLYKDIGAEADTVDTARSPIVWQLVSPPRQSLLTGPDVTSHQYRQVTFQWHVQALSTGENSINIVLRLYYIYLDGSEHDGTIQMTQQPIPIIAVQPSPISNSLPSVKLPLAGLTWLAGFFAVLRFIWKAYQTIHDVTEPVKQAADVAVAVKKRMAGGDQSAQQSTQQPAQRVAASGYPNPWAQPGTWQSPPQQGAPQLPPDSSGSSGSTGRSRPLPPPAPPPNRPATSWPSNQQPPSGPPHNSGGW